MIRARLVITDEELAPLIRALSSSLGGLPEVGEKLARLRKKRDERAETEAVGEALAFIASHNRMLDEIEMSALKRLTVEVGED